MAAPAPKATKKRADVKSEAKTANKAGDVAKGEGDMAAPAAPSAKKRAEVKAEAKAANKAGEVGKGEASK